MWRAVARFVAEALTGEAFHNVSFSSASFATIEKYLSQHQP